MLLKKFPLFYIALKYSFSAKDKVVFIMNQFAMFCIVLTVGLILSIFSIMSGFEKNFMDGIVGHYGHINIRNDDSGGSQLEQAWAFNTGFEKLPINHENIKSIEYIKMQQTLVVINGNKQYKMLVIEDENLKYPIGIPENLFKNTQNIDSIDVFDPQSYNPGGMGIRHKVYKKYTLVSNKVEEPVIFMSSVEYKKLFRNEAFTFAKVYVNDVGLTNITLNSLRAQLNKSNIKLKVSSWKDINPHFISALNLQNKIFFLLYFILFVLLTSVIVSINVAFFKEKRKDWALLKILDVAPLSVEKIFFYKSLISVFLVCSLGTILGYVLTIYSNDIVSLLLSWSGAEYNPDLFFGQEKIPYSFDYKDFIKVNAFASIVFFLNFVVLLLIFRKENVSSLFKLGGD